LFVLDPSWPRRPRNVWMASGAGGDGREVSFLATVFYY
jgi:hypothetical protein